MNNYKAEEIQRIEARGKRTRQEEFVSRKEELFFDMLINYSFCTKYCFWITNGVTPSFLILF